MKPEQGRQTTSGLPEEVRRPISN